MLIVELVGVFIKIYSNLREENETILSPVKIE